MPREASRRRKKKQTQNHCGKCRWYGSKVPSNLREWNNTDRERYSVDARRPTTRQHFCRWCGFFGIVATPDTVAWDNLDPDHGPFWSDCRGWERKEWRRKVAIRKGQKALQAALSDPRCPPPGTALSRIYRTPTGEYRTAIAKVTTEGFLCEGKRFDTLSGAANWWGKKFLGWGSRTRVDGWLFFGQATRRSNSDGRLHPAVRA